MFSLFPSSSTSVTLNLKIPKMNMNKRKIEFWLKHVRLHTTALLVEYSIFSMFLSHRSIHTKAKNTKKKYLKNETALNTIEMPTFTYIWNSRFLLENNNKTFMENTSVNVNRINITYIRQVVQCVLLQFAYTLHSQGMYVTISSYIWYSIAHSVYYTDL